MKVDLIKKQIQSFTEYLNSGGIKLPLYLWEVQDEFTKNWDLEVLDFFYMFEQSFSSNKSLRLWKREDYYPKEIMLKMIALDKEMMRSIFRNLLNEENVLNLRTNRFVLHLDQMLALLQRKDQKIAQHYHSNLEFVFVYLSFIFPDVYCPFRYETFNRYLEKVEARNIPRTPDPKLFKNLAKATRLLLSKDENFMRTSKAILSESSINSPHLHLWTFLFYHFVAFGNIKDEIL